MNEDELERLNAILERYGMNLISVVWILRIRDNPNCKITDIAKNRLDGNNIRVSLRSRSLSDFVDVKVGENVGKGRPPFLLNLNKRGLNICADLDNLIKRG